MVSMSLIHEHFALQRTIVTEHAQCVSKAFFTPGMKMLLNYYTAQQKFPNCSFKDPNLKKQVVKRWTIFFCTFWHFINRNPSSNVRDMVISMLVHQVLKMIHLLFTGLHPLQQPMLVVCFLWPPNSHQQLGNVTYYGDQ